MRDFFKKDSILSSSKATSSSMSNPEEEVEEGEQTTLVKKLEVENVVIHPLVLLSAADHYNRVARGTRKRVVGVLLGSISKGTIDAANSFALPFEEDVKNPVR